jgi:hypothetical protein
MHKYLRSVGFSLYKNEGEIKVLLDRLQEQNISKAYVVNTLNDDIRWEIRAEISPGMGVSMSGTVDENGEFVREWYTPYFEAEEISSDVECSIQRHVDNEVYSGLLDDNRVGISLIFRLDNAMEYLERKKKLQTTHTRGIQLTAFSSNGKILLPMKKSTRQKQLSEVANKTRDSLIEAAKKGDENAMESLTNEDINLYSVISRRMLKEDIYSIIDSCFMPQGIECDIYSVIGDIVEMESKTNDMTGEEIWDFLIDCNDVLFHVATNKADLQGDPQPGRRFKGTIWMQGRAVWA